MKYPTSETTKQELSAALKTLMSQKPLEKISIREITDLCGLRRETFYYHFADIYDLVKWMFEEWGSFLYTSMPPGQFMGLTA